jgi:hypothetical protein
MGVPPACLACQESAKVELVLLVFPDVVPSVAISADRLALVGMELSSGRNPTVGARSVDKDDAGGCNWPLERSSRGSQSSVDTRHRSAAGPGRVRVWLSGGWRAILLFRATAYWDDR